MKYPELISVSELVKITYSTALSLTIDSPSNMKNDRVYLFSGSQDTVVKQGMCVYALHVHLNSYVIWIGVMKKLLQYYSHFTANLETQFSVPSEHAMVSSM